MRCGLPDRPRRHVPERRPSPRAGRFFHAPLEHSLPKPSYSGPYQTSISVIHDRQAILDCLTFSGRNAGSYRAIAAGRPLSCQLNGRFWYGEPHKRSRTPTPPTRALKPRPAPLRSPPYTIGTGEGTYGTDRLTCSGGQKALKTSHIHILFRRLFSASRVGGDLPREARR
jgi:hypothetical protein